MPAATRRTQGERRATTRAAILNAALEILIEEGLANFTTTKVGERAGISQGALFNHFDTKPALLAATAKHLFASLVVDFEAAYEAAPHRTVEDALELLWRSMLDERLSAAYELYTAARTDPVMRADLEPVVAAHSERIFELAGSIFADTAVDDYGSIVSLAILSIQGLLVNQMVHPSKIEIDALRRTLRRVTSSLTAPAD